MDGKNLPRPFLIELNGNFVVNPDPAQVKASLDGNIPAVMGDRGNAAVFEFRDGYLRKTVGPDVLYFGRHRTEPWVCMPVPVYWIPKQGMAQECMFEGNEDSPTEFKCAGYPISYASDQGNWVRAYPPGTEPSVRMNLHWQ